MSISAEEARKNFMLILADALDKCERHGSEQDEPEGSRVVTFSDSLVRGWSHRLKTLALAKE